MKVDIFIEGTIIDLICLNAEIVEESNWYNWFNDEHLTKYMQKHYYPNTKDLQLDYFRKSIENNSKRVQCGIYHKADKMLIGTVSLNSIDFINRNCELSIIIGDRKSQNLNALVDAHKLMLRHAFDTLNLNRVYGGSVIKEINMLFCRALGYTNEGVSKNHVYKNGKYLDLYRFAILSDQYLALRDKWFKDI
jgi:RimJ/RimL family protein N-acetyltransferase